MIILCALVGLIMGSVLNWAGENVPRRIGTAATPSRGLTTQPGLALWHVLAGTITPVRRRTSLRRRKSRWMHAGVEILTAALFAYLWGRFGPSWEFLWLALHCCLFILIAIIDLKHRLVLNVLIVPAMVGTLLLHALPPSRETLTTLLGGAIGFAPFLLVALLRPGSIGGGDVKLAALVGLAVGFPQVLFALALGILAGGCAALFLLLTHRLGPKGTIPYAPFLCLGAVFSLLSSPFPFPV